MNFWQQLQIAAEMGPTLPWVLLIFILAAVVLFALKPSERRRIRAALLLLALAAVGFIVAVTLLWFGVSPTRAAFKWVKWSSLILQWFAFVNIAGVIVFEVFLDALRQKPPRILRDLLLALTYIVVAIAVLSHDTDLTGIVATSPVLTAPLETPFPAEPINAVSAQPLPNCGLMDFKESYCSYAVRDWLSDLAVDDPTDSVVRTRIYFALSRANIPLSIPAHSLFVTDQDES